MLRELAQNGICPIARMNGDIGIDKVSQDNNTISISAAQGHFDRFSFFHPIWLRHPAQSCNRILQTVASGENRDDVAEAGDLEINLAIRIGEFRRNSNGLAVAGFENAG